MQILFKTRYFKNYLLKSNISIRRLSWNCLFFGSDEFSLFSLKQLNFLLENKKHISNLEVVTTVSRNPNPVLKYARKNNLIIHNWPPDVKGFNSKFDIGIVVSFGHLIPKKLINYFPMGMLNVHASLLPRWRGASPIIHSLMAGDTETGVSIMRIQPHHFDTGSVVLQKSCPIHSDELMPELYARLGKLGATALVESIALLPECLEKSIPQDEELVTYAPRISSDIAEVRWHEQTSQQVYNLYRALTSLHHLKTFWHGNVVKLKKVEVAENVNSVNPEPGRLFWHRSEKILTVNCQTGCVKIDSLNVGGKSLKAIDFFNGYMSKRPQKDWIFS